jgi:hypothetical protein
MPQLKELRGIGGWLAYLILGLCVLYPLVGSYQGYQNFSAAESNPASLTSLANWAAYKQAAWALFALASALHVVSGFVLLLSRQWSAVRLAIVVLWVCPLLAAVGEYLLVFLFFGWSVSNTAPLWQLAQGWFWAVVWSAYLIKSVRVRNTYGVRPNNSFKPKPLRGSA